MRNKGCIWVFLFWILIALAFLFATDIRVSAQDRRSGDTLFVDHSYTLDLRNGIDTIILTKDTVPWKPYYKKKKLAVGGPGVVVPGGLVGRGVSIQGTWPNRKMDIDTTKWGKLQGSVTSVYGRTGAINQQSNVYTWWKEPMFIFIAFLIGLFLGFVIRYILYEDPYRKPMPPFMMKHKYDTNDDIGQHHEAWIKKLKNKK